MKTGPLVFGAIALLIAGMGLAQWFDGGRQERFLSELETKCMPRPGERTVAVNDGGELRCDRQKLERIPALRWPWSYR